MGTVLELDSDYADSISNRIPWNNYVVLMPCRNADGSFYQKRVMIPANRDVTKGYLPLTSAEIIKQTFKLLGNRYGWGGMLHSQDCSSMVKDVYRCFGLEIPRNTTWQAAMPVQVTDLSKMTKTEKYETLSKLTPGSIIQFPGHEMIFLGEVNGKIYTINNVSSMADPENTSSVLRVRGVIINDLLSTKRKSGITWFEALDKTIEVWN